MTIVETRFSLGDVVFGVQPLTAKRRPLCTLCSGTGRVALAVDDTRSAVCPDCRGRRYDQDDSHASTQERATIYRLTIGEVRWGSRDGASYMADETGVGSGTRWDEDKLYGTFQGALNACADAVVVFGYLAVGDPRTQTVIRGDADLEAWS